MLLKPTCFEDRYIAGFTARKRQKLLWKSFKVYSRPSINNFLIQQQQVDYTRSHDHIIGGLTNVITLRDRSRIPTSGFDDRTCCVGGCGTPVCVLDLISSLRFRPIILAWLFIYCMAVNFWYN